MTTNGEPPPIRRILETALYVGDLARALTFYEELLELTPLARTDAFAALDAGQGTVLLLFETGSAAEGAETEGGWIPPHDSRGPAHVAFAVADEEALCAWADRLEAAGYPPESRVRWPRGGLSAYVRDPDGHSVELASPGIWPAH